MSNRAFDRLAALQDLKDAMEHLDCWGRSLVRTDLAAVEVAFCAKSFRSAQERVEFARLMVLAA